MKKNHQPTELSYYGLYLLDYLQESHPYKSQDADFIRERADQAAEVFEQARAEGYSPDAAQELAMATLLQGLHFSPYDTLVEVLSNEFAQEVTPEEVRPLALNLLPRLKPLFLRYALSDDFTQTPEYDLLYTGLTGAVVTYFESDGI